MLPLRRHTTAVRAGVIGVGNMGANHARVYASMPHRAELVGVYDPNLERAEEVARRYETRAFPELEQLLDAVEAVSIASPTSLHFEHAATALERGVHVLIEKPVTLTIADALRLRDLAHAAPGQPVVQVGHIEEFNPAVTEVRKILAGRPPVALTIQRLSHYDGRIQDADVVQDLMLHDVHVALAIAGSTPHGVHAAGRVVRSEAAIDYAVANLLFDDGLIATLVASRITQEKVRQMTVSTGEAHVTVDFLQRTISVSRWTNLSVDVGDDRAYKQESVIERIFVPIEEPLVAEIGCFLAAVATGDPPRVPLETGIRCLEIVERVRAGILAAPAARPRVRAA
jgi:predicted dehydrogenase